MNYSNRFYASLAGFDRLNPPALPFVFLLAIAAVLIRMPNLLFAPSLWAEDLVLYIAEAQRFGLASVVQPAAGYYQLFSRLVAVVVVLVAAPKHVELLFHLAALAVIYFSFLVTWLSLPIRSFTALVVACLAIVWVPVNSAWLYLTLCNTQWILGASTTLLIVTNYIPRSRHKPLWCAVLAVLCLNGPFAVLCLPAIFARMLFYRDLKQQKLFYLSMLVPIAIQSVTLVMFAGPRLDTVTSTSAHDWYVGIVQNTVFRFIPNQPLLFLFGVFLAVLFWVLARDANRERIFCAGALLGVALINAAAGFYSYRYMPASVGPFANGERYFFIPFLLFIYFVLSSARGWLRPIALFFVAFACLSNVRPFDVGPDGRGPGYWPSQIELSRYMATTKALTHPILPGDVYKYEVYNPVPEIPPVLKHFDDLADMELAGLSATQRPQGGWTLAADSSAHDAGRNLLIPPWKAGNVTSVDLGDGVLEATISTKNDAWWQTVQGIAVGGTLTFSFEARSEKQLTIHPHLTDGIYGRSFTAELGPQWEKFVFHLNVVPFTAQNGSAFVLLGASDLGTFQVRNLWVTLAPAADLRIRIPDACMSHDNVALTYSASSAQPGFDKLNASSNNARFKERNTQYRWIGAEERNVMVAVPNDGLRWLRLTPNLPLNIRDIVLRCY